MGRDQGGVAGGGGGGKKERRRRVQRVLEAGWAPGCKMCTMAIDWVDFGYTSVIASGGFLGYHRKGSVVSLVAGLFFGLLVGCGSYRISCDPRDVKMSLFTPFFLATIMGIRFKRYKKVMPAGIVAGLSLLRILRLILILI
ncbi:transmembrane protein 14A-like [Phascolarctos cinereus]